LTLADLVRDAARRMRAAPLAYGHGTTNARDEAAFLVLRGLRLPFDTPASREATRLEQARIASLLQRRLRDRVPTAYLLREAWLAGERFYVDRRAIVPRSHIAQMLAERMRPWLPRAPRRVLDLCTGSGCLAILAAKAFPRARVDAADLSRGALEVAARNLALHRLSHRVRLWRSDLLAKLAGERYEDLDVEVARSREALRESIERRTGNEQLVAPGDARQQRGLEFGIGTETVAATRVHRKQQQQVPLIALAVTHPPRSGGARLRRLRLGGQG